MNKVPKKRLGARRGPQNATGPRAKAGTCPKLKK